MRDDYERTTRRTATSALPPPLRDALAGAGDLAKRTVVLSSPVFGQGPTHPRGTFAVIFESTDDARAARSALEDARAAHWGG